MINLINFSTNLYVRYVLIFLFFLLIGRSFVIVSADGEGISKRDLKLSPDYIVSIVDQTDIGDELCRYKSQRIWCR